jgi:hypothetical protein
MFQELLKTLDINLAKLHRGVICIQHFKIKARILLRMKIQLNKKLLGLEHTTIKIKVHFRFNQNLSDYNILDQLFQDFKNRRELLLK